MGILSSIKEKIFGKPAACEIKASAAAAAGQTVSAVMEPVDVEAIIEAAVKAKDINLSWRVSIVDLLKALDIDSSLTARRELAADLKYNGAHPDGSPEKNMWLHKEVLNVLAQNGGMIPEDLLS